MLSCTVRRAARSSVQPNLLVLDVVHDVTTGSQSCGSPLPACRPPCLRCRRRGARSLAHRDGLVDHSQIPRYLGRSRRLASPGQRIVLHADHGGFPLSSRSSFLGSRAGAPRGRRPGDPRPFAGRVFAGIYFPAYFQVDLFLRFCCLVAATSLASVYSQAISQPTTTAH